MISKFSSQISWKLWLWIPLLLLIFIYCVISEIRSQDCLETCENQAPEPLPTDTPDELKEKIAEGTRILYQTVEWRKAMAVAVLSIFFILLIFPLFFIKPFIFPRGIDISIALLTVFIISYLLIFVYLQEHFWKPIGIQIREASELL